MAGDVGVGGDAVPGTQRTPRHGQRGALLILRCFISAAVVAVVVVVVVVAATAFSPPLDTYPINTPSHPLYLPPDCSSTLLYLSGAGGLVFLRGLRGMFLVWIPDAAALPGTTRRFVPSVHEHW